jgi:hypothetical protein
VTVVRKRVTDRIKEARRSLAELARRYGSLRAEPTDRSAAALPRGAPVQGTRSVGSAALLQQHYSERGECLCLDIFIRLLAIEQFAGADSSGIALYDKLWIGHGRKPRSVDGFQSLVASFQARGYDAEKPISLQRHPERGREVFADGKHRFACALFFEIGDVPVRLSSRTWPIADNSAGGLLRIGFTHAELDRILEAEARYLARLGAAAGPGDPRFFALGP